MGKTELKAVTFQYIMRRSKPDGKCLVWTGARSKAGYGNMKMGGKTVAVHRVAWEVVKGKIPKDKWLRHRCGNGLCINIDHLWLGPRGRMRK